MSVAAERAVTRHRTESAPAERLFARITLRERPLTDTLDLALWFVTRHGAAYAKLAAWVLLPFGALTWASLAWDWWGGAIVALALGTIADGAFTVLAGRLVFTPSIAVGAVLRAWARLIPKLLFTNALRVALLAAGGLFFLVPALWLLVATMFLHEVVALESLGIGAAATRMTRLSSGRFGDAFLASFVLDTLRIVVVASGMVAGYMVVGDVLEVHLVEDTLVPFALVAYGASIPYFATARLFVYLNFRTRSEGWDIQTRFAELDARGLSMPAEDA
jgi:hypothetical protein